MKDELSKLLEATDNMSDKTMAAIEKLADVAKPQAVFSDPMEAAGYQVITASEVMLGLGLGFGGGGGEGAEDENGEQEGEETEEVQQMSGMGVGGGGGGGASGRPVAIISLTQDGVKVEPIVDVTKLALGFFAAMGALFISIGTARRAKR
jgi:uncharacterized spore protein YtfJ